MIPNALVADQFRPSPGSGFSHPSKHFVFGNSWPWFICKISSYHRSYFSPGVSQRNRSLGGSCTTHLFCIPYRQICDRCGPHSWQFTSDSDSIGSTKGGTGPKLNELLQMREKHLLQDRIELLGPVRHSDVRDVSCLHFNASVWLPRFRNNLGIIGSCSWFHILEYLFDGVFWHCYP